MNIKLKYAFAHLIIAASLLLGGINFALAEEEEYDEHAFIELMQSYLDTAQQLVKVASSKEAMMFIAVEDLVEIHQARGDIDKAIEYLNGVIEKNPNNLAIRNLVHSKLKDIYMEQHNAEQALVSIK